MDCLSVLSSLKRILEPIGMEIHPFNTGWYNNMVGKPFQLPYESDTVGFVVISTPEMFEKAFIPYIRNKLNQEKIRGNDYNGSNTTIQRDPLDSCLTYHLNEAKEHFPDQELEIIQDYEILPNKRPKILVQSAAHVAGAAYYYQKSDVLNKHKDYCPCIKNESEDLSKQSDKASIKSYNGGRESEKNQKTMEAANHNQIKMRNVKVNAVENDTSMCKCVKAWDMSKRIYGVCVHPKYGGWFAIRSVIIFPKMKEKLTKPSPPDCVDTRELRIELLNRFNGNWKDWTYRDIIPVTKRYSELQKKYFATMPKDRHEIIAELITEK